MWEIYEGESPRQAISGFSISEFMVRRMMFVSGEVCSSLKLVKKKWFEANLQYAFEKRLSSINPLPDLLPSAH